MATARKKVSHPADSSSTTSFEVYEDNSARFHWRLLTGEGRSLGHSDEAFVSPHDAEQAAEVVRQRVHGATIDRDLTSSHPSFNASS
jgi:uncharacterized protein YegP (UPF0339 family)